MAKIKIPKLEKKNFRGWTFVLVAGVVLAIVAIIDGGGLGCRLEVTADELRVFSGPNPAVELVQTLRRDEIVDGTQRLDNGFRELGEGRWAEDQFLDPVPGSNCG